MNWLLLIEIAYVLIMVLFCLRVIYDTSSTSKTLAYIMLGLFLPVIGIIFYFSFGINYRKRKLYSKKLIQDDALARRLKEFIFHYSKHILENTDTEIAGSRKLSYMLLNSNLSALTANNTVDLLINGEKKFPEVLSQIARAKHHIHIEYYIYEDDEIGRAVEQALIQKVSEGVEVRFLYDDFGSHAIGRKLVHRLKKGGVKTFPFRKVTLIALANRLNYRNHRKIIVIDGQTAFVGGINVSDKYINNPSLNNKLYWRDTHLMIRGPGAYYLQYLFICDWNFASKENLHPSRNYFPEITIPSTINGKLVQIAASGPDSDAPTIQLSLIQAINLATSELLITTPYFIPGESIIDALIIAALGGVKIRLLVPGISDSVLVNAAARSYYGDLLRAGVEIYRYQKGFVHAKTLVMDRKLAIVGSANMDYRSYDLNFEVNAVVYDQFIATELAEAFEQDMNDADKIDPQAWLARPAHKQLIEKTARMVSPLL